MKGLMEKMAGANPFRSLLQHSALLNKDFLVIVPILLFVLSAGVPIWRSSDILEKRPWGGVAFCQQ